MISCWIVYSVEELDVLVLDDEMMLWMIILKMVGDKCCWCENLITNDISYFWEGSSLSSMSLRIFMLSDLAWFCSPLRSWAANVNFYFFEYLSIFVNIIWWRKWFCVSWWWSGVEFVAGSGDNSGWRWRANFFSSFLWKRCLVVFLVQGGNGTESACFGGHFDHFVYCFAEVFIIYFFFISFSGIK